MGKYLPLQWIPETVTLSTPEPILAAEPTNPMMGGATWTAMKMANLIEGEDTFAGQSVTAVAVAPSDSNVVWASHNYWLANSRDGGANLGTHPP